MATVGPQGHDTFNSTDVLARLAPFSQIVQRRLRSRSPDTQDLDQRAENVARRRSSRWATKVVQQSGPLNEFTEAVNRHASPEGSDVDGFVSKDRQAQKFPESAVRDMEDVVKSALGLAQKQAVADPELHASMSSSSLHNTQSHAERPASEPPTSIVQTPMTENPTSCITAEAELEIRPRISSREQKELSQKRNSKQMKFQVPAHQMAEENVSRARAVSDHVHSNKKPAVLPADNPESDLDAMPLARPTRPTTGSYDLRNRRHIDVEKGINVTFSRTHRRAPIARDWRTGKKRFVAAVQCINTSLIGLVIGIYAGEVPALQYHLVDQGHVTVLGNVFFFVGMAIPMLFFFTLPTLHGRKPYTLGALAMLMPLTFPQALAVQNQRGPDTPDYRVLLLVPRAFAGLAAGFMEMNLMTTLLDLFGASLQSSNPHQEIADPNDVRRHGGGMGIWLSIWTWCAIGSIGFGFFMGACIISALDPAWGFWIGIVLCAAILILNVVTPETRRSPYRRSMAEVRTGSEVFRRFAKGEFMMHLYQVGPVHWWEEMIAGWVLVIKMLAQPGFLMLSLYQGWVYAEVVMLIIVLGNLTSVDYQLHPVLVGVCVLSVPLGAAIAIPFQKASLFSRSRSAPPRTDSMTFEKRVTWTSHLVRRAFFVISLPLFMMAYTLSSKGSKVNIAVPILLAGIIGFLSNLALSEVFGILMETFDTSDLQPGMTGRPRKVVPDSIKGKRTNFSCFPRVTAAFMIVQGIAFLVSAAATGAGGAITHHVGAQKATGIVCAVLFGLSLLLILTLTRMRTVQVVPKQRYATGELSGPEDEWKPVIIGHPSGITRRVSLLELGLMTRWTEIRHKNKVYDTPPVSGSGSRRLNREADRAGD